MSGLPIVRDGCVAELMLAGTGSNQIDGDLHENIAAAFEELRRSVGVRVAVIGSAGRVFSAGGDFDLMIKTHFDFEFRMHHVNVGRNLLTSLLNMPFPVVAAVQGPAIGLGATIALACDMVVAAGGATFADPHVQVGLTAGDGGCLVWPQAAGMMRAKRYLLTGDRLGAEDAHRFGLVTDLVDNPDDALPAARALAQRIAALPPLAVQGTKQTLNNVMRARAAEVVELGLSYEVQSAVAEDFLEAVAAAKERRPGNYAGR